MGKIHRWIIGLAVLVLLFLALSQQDYGTKHPQPKPSVEKTEPAEHTEAVKAILEARQRIYTLGRIIDGDTFIAVDSAGNELKIRMAGIDAPEVNQVFGKESAEYLTVLLHDHFKLRLFDKDRYDRQIATVLVNDRDINQDMVANGYAWAYDYRIGPNYQEDQDEARAERRGLWNEKSTLPPQYFRKINGHSEFGHQLLKGGFYLWDGVIHNHNCPGKVDANHSWNGIDPYENCPKCGGLVYD